MVAALPETTTITVTAQRPPAASPAQPSFFRRLLSELNPLQYVPVVGTIYRAVTGDTIPETARLAGSLVVSGLTGGPIGLAINIGATALEKLTGIDPETIGTRLLADIGLGPKTPTATYLVKPGTIAAKPAYAPQNQGAGNEKPWSAAQLVAYGVKQAADGTLRRGGDSGADVLNSLELARLKTKSGGLFAAVA